MAVMGSYVAGLKATGWQKWGVTEKLANKQREGYGSFPFWNVGSNGRSLRGQFGRALKRELLA